jgi:putative ABC transport system permease protein
VLTLGLGIGAATAIFSAVYPVLFQPLSYPDAGRILAISDRSTDGAEVPITYGSYRELVERNRSFQAMAAYKPWQPTATGGEPERLEGQRVGADFFRVLGVVPSLGRGFDAADDRPGGANVVILSHGLWQRRFGGDSTIIGRDVQLDGVGYRVGGVMPREFENVPPHAAQVWSLLRGP